MVYLFILLFVVHSPPLQFIGLALAEQNPPLPLPTPPIRVHLRPLLVALAHLALLPLLHHLLLMLRTVRRCLYRPPLRQEAHCR